MKAKITHEILMEAADIVSRSENKSKDFILAVWSPEKIIKEAKEIRIEREKRMDEIRMRW